MIFEVRVPTYNRPVMLRRAIESLKSQRYPHWRAIVFDDASSSSASQIVEAASDERLVYRRNKVRFGAARNIDQCFTPEAQANGIYACLLEDDNFWFPRYLELVYNIINSSSWSILLLNQIVADKDGAPNPSGETTRGHWFTTGEVSPSNLRANLLLNEGISNGGLVWRLSGKTDLRVGSNVTSSGLQEACRSLLIKEPFYFTEDAQAVWTFLDKADTARAAESNRIFGRGMQSIRDFVLQKDGSAAISKAAIVAARLGLKRRLADVLAYSGYLKAAFELYPANAVQNLRQFAKGKAIRVVQDDPCGGFLSGLT